MSARTLLRAGRSAAFAFVVASSASFGACAEEFDTTRRAPAPVSFGDDLFQVLCDRVAATADPGDTEARKSRVVCHPDETGTYGTDYLDGDGAMPPKVAVMVKHRARLIEALNATFPDEKYGDPSEKQTFHNDLSDLMRALVPLYDDDTLPESTRTLAAIFETIFFDENTVEQVSLGEAARKAKIQRGNELRAALARIGGRKGYRTISTALGAVRPVLAYPKLNDLVDQTIRLLGPDGAAKDELHKVLEVAQVELASTTIPSARTKVTGYDDRFTGQKDSLPKLTSEVLRNVLVDAPPLKPDLSGPAYPATWADAFAVDIGGASTPTVAFLMRDARGYAALAAPLDNAADKDGDGLPDVNELGQFVSKTGGVIAMPSPFAFVTASGVDKGKGPRDDLGRALVAPGGAPVYKYGDAARTLLHAVLRDSQLLADPKDPVLLHLAHGAVYQFGSRTETSKNYPDPDQPGKTVSVSFKQFKADESPLTDLVYALGVMMQLPQFKDYAELGRQLLRDHPTEAARVVKAALKLREIANKPEYASIALDPKSTVWDEVVGIAAQIAAEPDVMKDVLDSLADDDVLLLPKGMTAFAGNKDELDYNPAADSDASKISDPVWNTTTKVAVGPPKTATDLSKPDSDDNRSLFQRFLSLMNDAYQVKVCNKDGGKIKTSLATLPIFGSYKECEALEIPDLAVYYLDCIAGGNVEGTSTARCKLPVKDTVVSLMNSVLGSSAVDGILESSSGIKGLKQVPTTEALNRMAMWRNPNDFVRSFVDPMATNVCPIATSFGTRRCADPKDTLAQRQKATIFMGEEFDALKGLAPTVRAFVKHRADGKGREKYFLQLIGIFHRHWSPGGNPTRCVDGGTPDSNPRFCNKSNLRAYEPILAEAFASDLLPALNQLSKVTRGMVINGQNGSDVMASLVRSLLDPSVSKTLKLTDRHGSSSTTFNDGKTKVDQITPYYLFANAINGFDKMWVGADGDKDHATWRAARSKLVDIFLDVDQPGGDASKSTFKNAAIRAAGPILLDVLEDRIAEHKAKGDFDAWVHGDFAKSFQESIESPILASSMDLMDKIYKDEKARSTVGDLLVYLAQQGSANDALASTLTAVQDLLQVVGDDQNMVPLYHAFAVASAPDGATKRSLDLIDRIRRVETDPDFADNHGKRRVIPKVLGFAVKPMGTSQITPIEVFIDVVSDLHRADPKSTDAYFAPIDYGSVARNVQEFLIDPTRGLEQFYAIVKNRNP
ncbi:MAG: hypothetical protein ACXVEE_01540 [Polyangiales bacterium]